MVAAFALVALLPLGPLALVVELDARSVCRAAGRLVLVVGAIHHVRANLDRAGGALQIAVAIVMSVPAASREQSSHNSHRRSISIYSLFLLTTPSSVTISPILLILSGKWTVAWNNL